MDGKTVSPKIEIINHFDNLIQRVDIDIEESLEKYNEEQILRDLKCYETKEMMMNSRRNQADYRNKFMLYESPLNKPYSSKYNWSIDAKEIEKVLKQQKQKENPDDLKLNNTYKTVDLWSEETKVVDYLNQVRMRTIEELRKGQEEALESYKSQKDDSKRELYPDKFYFQVLYKQSEPEEWIFKLFTFVTDFYMSPIDITLLEKLINGRRAEDNKLFFRDSTTIFDEKMILIGLLGKCFFEHLKSEKFPSSVISVFKKELLNIKQIRFYYNVNEVCLTDLSTLESLYISETLGQINLDGISSLVSFQTRLNSLECLSVRNLPSLRHLDLSFNHYRIDSTIHPELFDYLPNIEYLSLDADLSYFNLDSLVNLKSLSLEGKIDKEFNFDLFKNICNQLEEISIKLYEIDYKCLAKLFYAHQFPIIKTFHIHMCISLTKLEKKLFDGFRMLQSLNITYNTKLQEIDRGAFSNLKQLTSLDLSSNFYNSSYKINDTNLLDQMKFSALINLKYLDLSHNYLTSIEENIFSNLTNLRVLDLSLNQLTVLDPKSFSSLKKLIWLNLHDNQLVQFDLCILDYIKEIKKISLSGNSFINKEEILSRFKESKIEFTI